MQKTINLRFARRLMTLTLSAVICAALTPASNARSKAQEEEVPQVCSGLTDEQMPVLAVMDFEEGPGTVTGVGGGFATMLMNALVGSGCFQVVETERLDEVFAEQRLGMSGAIEQGSAPSVGQMQGAQFLVMGKITEFNENESGGRVSAASIVPRRWRRGVGSVVGSVGMTTAHVGFVIRVVDPSTRRVIVSKSFDKKRKAVGVMGAGWFAGDLLSGMGFKSKAMADAVEEGLIDSVEVIAKEREKMARAARSRAALQAGSAPVPDRNECSALQAERPPRIMVVIPEEHITGDAGSYAADRNPYGFEEHETRSAAPAAGVADANALALAVVTRAIIRPPDPAGETEIIKRLLEFGYEVVDPRQLETLRERDLQRFLRVHDDPAVAAALGREQGADIVITGEAFSEFAMNLSGMYSCRARVESRAVETRTGRIIATDGLHGSGLDVSEVIAGKTALRNAGSRAADYFIARICESGTVASANVASGGNSAPAPSGGATRVIVGNVDFKTSSLLKEALESLEGVREVRKEFFKDRTVGLVVLYDGSSSDLADGLLEAGSGFGIEITALADGEIGAELAGAQRAELD